MSASYTEDQAGAFEAIHKALSANKFTMTVALKELRKNPDVVRIMYSNPCMETAMRVVRSPAFKEWLQDWMELNTLCSIRVAMNVLPQQVASEIGGQVRRYFRLEIAALAKKMHQEGRLEDMAEAMGEDVDPDLLSMGEDDTAPPPDEGPLF